MSMFDNDSYNDGVNAGKRIAIGCMVASLAVLAIILFTVSTNNKNNKRNNNINQSTLPTVSAEEVPVEKKGEYKKDSESRTSDELSFWNMYDKDEEEQTVISSDKTEKNKIREGKEELLKKLSEDAASANKAEEERKNQFNIKSDGDDPEYVTISRTLSPNELNKEGFRSDDRGRLYYDINGKSASFQGIDVSFNNGEIDWKKVREDGIDFAMLKIGSRGYSTGNILLDDNFRKNYDGCSQNKIDVGAYFFSQATTVEEAVEEANYCILTLDGRKLTYPVVFDSEAVANDSYRTENMTASAMTECAAAFCEVIKAYGYTPMIGGTKEQLVRNMNLSRLYNYGFWLLDVGEECDYPYRYAIRQYRNDGFVDGIEGKVSMDICFISYAER